MIGKLQRVPLREVWRHEALDFTRWLQENLDVLSDVLDLKLLNAEREQAAGDFSVDIVAEDEEGQPVVIENQLERSNHDHLGKLVTYLTALSAKTAIWIVSDARPEHIGAITWLNECGTASFYLVKLEGVRIGDSPPAPLLTLIVGPSDEGREVGATKKVFAERHVIRRQFWTGLLDYAKTRTKLHETISPTENGALGVSAGKRGLGLNYVIRQHDGRVELYISRGKESGDENAKIFDSLVADKPSIEAFFGGPLDWQRLEDKHACRICADLDGGYREQKLWPEIWATMVDAMIRLEKALRPGIEKLNI